MKSILSLRNEEAKEFLLKSESYVNIDLPPYIKFDTLLLKLSDALNGKDYFEIKKNSPSPNNLENVNYKLLHNKNGKYDWRPFQLIHPVLYISVVNQITKYHYWKEIKKRFGTIRGKSVVECISLPIVSETKKSDKAEQILNWWEQIEQKSLELSLEFSYIYHTDISDCYGSIYTHSIPWAIHSKKEAKEMKGKKGKKLIGNIVDRHLQAMSYGQTNGIPQGSVLMDFIAEMVLNYADLLLSKKIKEEGIDRDSFKILRYRDDYRIFVNNPTIADEIIKNLTEVLMDLGLKLHSQKTVNFDNVIQGSIKSDKIDWMMCKRNATTIQKQLLILHQFSNDNKNSGTLVKELQNILNKINKQTKENDKLKWFLKKENINVLISIVVDIAYRNPRTYTISVAILSKLFSLIPETSKISDIIKKVIKKFNNIPNTGHMQIWLQRAIIKLDFDENIFNESICKLVKNDNNIILWNNEWLERSIIDIFKNNSIVDEDEMDKINKVIDSNEVLLFSMYES